MYRGLRKYVTGPFSYGYTLGRGIRRYFRKPKRKKKTRRATVSAGYIRKVVRGMSETKHLDLGIAGTTPVGGTSQIVQLTNIDQGDTESTRDGDRVILKSFSMKGHIITDPDATNDTICRIIIFQTRNNIKGTAPVVTDVLATDNVSAIRSWDDRKDIRVYYDKRFIIPMAYSGALDATPDIQKWTLVEYYKKYKRGMKVTYDGTGGGSADAEWGHFWIILMTNQGAGFQPLWTLETRMCYCDI